MGAIGPIVCVGLALALTSALPVNAQGLGGDEERPGAAGSNEDPDGKASKKRWRLFSRSRTNRTSEETNKRVGSSSSTSEPYRRSGDTSGIEKRDASLTRTSANAAPVLVQDKDTENQNTNLMAVEAAADRDRARRQRRGGLQELPFSPLQRLFPST